jgi:hypothetical protein
LSPAKPLLEIQRRDKSQVHVDRALTTSGGNASALVSSPIAIMLALLSAALPRPETTRHSCRARHS